MAELLCSRKYFHLVSVEVPLDCNEDISVVVADGNMTDILAEETPILTVMKPPSMTEV